MKLCLKLVPISDAKDIAVDVYIFDRLALINVRNPIFGIIYHLIHRIRPSNENY